ncbi:hypothetical protein LCGC14_0391040 [marine sediment metagenome]|uniref:Uncharacterized protein n=1 Tax=marine sediment metagenome TaxID=412755 RepID=A0A0F9VLP0_9ZZZZ
MNEQKAAPNDPQVLLRTKDFLVSRTQKTLNAPPFLALAIELGHLPDTRIALQALVKTGFTPQKLLQKFPNVTAWAICASLLENYGQGTQEIWPLIGRLFGKDPSLAARTEIVDSFKSVCRKIGLVTDGFDRNVDVFLIHVGVARGQLGHVAKAFLQQEAANGLPSSDDVVQLNRWEDDAVLTFLPVGVHVPERPILHDETAWMAALFLKWRADPSDLKKQSTFAAEFADTLERIEKDVGSTTLLASQPSPRLIWLDGRPQLQVPAGAGRLQINIGSQPLRLKRGQTWPLPNPLPTALTWIADGEQRHLPLYDASFVIFEPEDGRLLVPRKGTNEWIVQTSVALVTSTREFTVDGVPADLFGPDLYVAQVNLRKNPAELRSSNHNVLLRGSKRTRISIEGRPIAVQSGRAGSLWSGDAAIVLEAALYTDRRVTIQVECGDQSERVLCQLDENDIGRLSVANILKSLGLDQTGDPIRIVLTMLREADGQLIETRIRREIIVWPTYAGLDGVTFLCANPPSNFVEASSKYVLHDASGNLCLDRRGGYDKALMGFEIGSETRQFLVDWPDISMVLERTNGTREPLMLGSAIILGPDDWHSSLVVRSPDRRATLTIAGRQLERPFANTGSWAIPLRQLHQTHDNQIFLLNGAARTLLARIETVAAPNELVVNHRADGVTARISAPFSIGGLLLVAEDEDGEVVSSEFSYDHFPTDMSAETIATAKKTADDSVTILLKNSRSSEKLRLFDISLREVGRRTWTRLSTNRGDRITLAVPASEPADPSVDAMARIDAWMSQCFAAECWDGGLNRLLTSRWAEVVRAIDHQAGGRAAVLSLAHAEEGDFNWLPMKHLVEIVPELHSSEAFEYSALKAIDSQIGRALSGLSSIGRGQIRQNPSIDPRAFLGFKNARSADRLGEELSGFSALRLISVLQMLGVSRAFWDGRIVLGPEHRQAAMSGLIERCEDFRLFSEDAAEGPMSLRSARLNKLMQGVIKDGPSIPKGPEHDEQDYLLWIDQTLMAYAKAARRRKVADFFDTAAQATGFSMAETKRLFGELLRLGPELLTFHLLCQELEKLRS